MTSPARPVVIGVDLGGTQLKLVALTADGELCHRETLTISEALWREEVTAAIAAFEARTGQPAAIGVAAPGLVSRDERHIAHLPTRLPGLEGLDWTSLLRRPNPVPVLNDAHAALLGEVWRGAARGERDVLLLTLGTGVGGAILSDGRLLRGHLGRAGHAGHMTLQLDGPRGIVGTPGTLEDLIGNHSVSRRAQGRFTDTAKLVAAARTGDRLAQKVWQDSVRALAAAIASLVNIVDPAVILLGGGIAQAGDDLLAPLRQALEPWEWRPGGARVRLALATLGPWAGAYGAAARALNLFA